MELLGALFSGIGTQDPAHSLFSLGERLPLNARETGIFAGLLIAALLRAVTGSARGVVLPAPLPMSLLSLGIAAGALDGVQAMLGEPLYAATLTSRYAAGAAFGLCGGLVLLPVWCLVDGSCDLTDDTLLSMGSASGTLLLGGAALTVLLSSVDLSPWPLGLASSAGAYLGGGLVWWPLVVRSPLGRRPATLLAALCLTALTFVVLGHLRGS